MKRIHVPLPESKIAPLTKREWFGLICMCLTLGALLGVAYMAGVDHYFARR
jgi:hypothetical protein